MSTNVENQFGAIRSLLWPIHRSELGKVLPMSIMLFFICFNYSTLRNMKDALVVTTSGAEVLPFIKVWAVLPCAVIMTLIFTKLSNRFSQEKVFYIMTSFFLIFFALFAFVIYPLRDSLHPTDSVVYLQNVLPSGFKGLIAMYQYWTFTGFYVISELWSTMVMSVLFWGFANEITKLAEARRFYSVLSIVANFAAIAAGGASIVMAQEGSWGDTITILLLGVIGSGILTMVTFFWMNKKVLNNSSYEDLHQIKQEKSGKRKLSFRESLSYIANSKYLICISVLVIAYNLVIHLVEVVWKDQLTNLYPSPLDYNNYINYLSVIQGVVSTILSLSLATMINRMGWAWTALITPVVMAVTCMGFFGILAFQGSLSTMSLSFLGMTPLAIAVFFGSMQNCLSKACKYSVFDATKEMAYIPLSHDSKLKGKAAIDGVGSRLGKSGGSVVHQGLLMIFTTVAASASYVGVILLGVIVLWIIAIRSLGTEFDSLFGTATKKPAAI